MAPAIPASMAGDSGDVPLYHLGRHFPGLLSERSGSLWPAALAHGTINAAAQVALLFRGAEGAVRQIWGPAVTGILAGMPMLVLSAVLLVRKGSWRKSW